MDPRNEKLAAGLIRHSCRLQKGEKILVECTGIEAIPLVDCVVREIYRAGGLPFVTMYNNAVQRSVKNGLTNELADKICQGIGSGGGHNDKFRLSA